MSFRDLTINVAYETGNDDLVNSFYIPVLSNTVSYDRIAGFFSSTSLAISARGLYGLLSNNGSIRLIACPRLSQEDIQVISDSTENPEKYLEDRLLSEIDSFADEFQQNHIQALGWMLANGYLNLKLALIYDEKYRNINENALFHQKVGILTDLEGNEISFSGSLNETAAGWLENVEEFKVFKSWVPGQDDYLAADRKKFNNYWNDLKPGVKVIDVPYAVKERLMQIGNGFSKESLSLERYLTHSKKKKEKKSLNLYWYQEEAQKKWIDNDYRLLFEMATGTGKTRTTIGCISHLIEKEKKLICIIACPETTLSHQWETELNNLDIQFEKTLIADGSNPNWKKNLSKYISQLNIGYLESLVIFTTHDTASSESFIYTILDVKSVPICFVGDEVHGLGSTKQKQALLSSYQYRIGLSATPSRWFDEEGTELIADYFGNSTYEFGISRALTEINPSTGDTFLVQYEYYPRFTHLTEEELESYAQLSKKIKKLSFYEKKTDEAREYYEGLCFRRAKIVKNASNKLVEFRALLAELQVSGKKISNTIIFVDSEQMEEVFKILGEYDIIAHKFTQEEGTKCKAQYGGMTERQKIIDQFKQGLYSVLVAINCLDEGIDIPSADTAIILASTTNPRQYIQRIGRVIRRNEGKKRAYIYDFIVSPTLEMKKYDLDLYEFERGIFEKELIRSKSIAVDAFNNADALKEINDLKYDRGV